jgi:hypothetical protein
MSVSNSSRTGITSIFFVCVHTAYSMIAERERINSNGTDKKRICFSVQVQS